MILDSITTLDHPDGEPYLIPDQTALDKAKGRVKALRRTGDENALKVADVIQAPLDQGALKDSGAFVVNTPYFES